MSVVRASQASPWEGKSMAFSRLCLLKFNLQEPWVTADMESTSLQVQALPYTTLSYISSLPTFCQTSTLTFLKFFVMQVSLCPVQVLQCMPELCPSFLCSGVTNIPVSIQPCSGTSAPHRPSLRGCLALLPGGRWCACLGTACPQLLAEELGASREASDGCIPSRPSPPPLCPLRGSSSKGQCIVFNSDAQSKILFSFSRWEALLISTAFWVLGFTGCWTYLWSHV